jgi:hypothetical protein
LVPLRSELPFGDRRYVQNRIHHTRKLEISTFERRRRRLESRGHSCDLNAL